MPTIDYAYQVHKLLNRKRVTIACLIPAFNEGPRVGKVLEVVTNFPAFDEIVLINDGSSDNTVESMKYYASHNNNIKVVDLKKNVGKTSAVLSGMKLVKSDLVCLIDADLEGLKYDYIYKMIYYLLTHEFDMTILDRGGDRMGLIGWSQSWVIRFIGGERAIWKKDFEKIKFGKTSRYAIEQEINMYYVQNGLKVRTIYCPELLAMTHMEKDGFLEGLKVYGKMTKEIYSHSKSDTFFYQVENIVEDRIEPLYKLLEKSPVKKPVVGAILITGLLSSIGLFTWLNIKKKAESIRKD